jgi:hypothetical protein
MTLYQYVVQIMSWDQLHLERQEAEIYGVLAMSVNDYESAGICAEKGRSTNAEIVRRARIGWDMNTENQAKKFDRSL